MRDCISNTACIVVPIAAVGVAVTLRFIVAVAPPFQLKIATGFEFHYHKSLIGHILFNLTTFQNFYFLKYSYRERDLLWYKWQKAGMTGVRLRICKKKYLTLLIKMLINS